MIIMSCLLLFPQMLGLLFFGPVASFLLLVDRDDLLTCYV